MSVIEAIRRLIEILEVDHDKTAARDFLLSLRPEAVRTIEVVMYSGRDKEAFEDVAAELARDDHETTVSVILGKGPAPGYLRAGIERMGENHAALAEQVA